MMRLYWTTLAACAVLSAGACCDGRAGQLAELEMAELYKENERLRAQVAKLEAEKVLLAAENDDLRIALETADQVRDGAPVVPPTLGDSGEPVALYCVLVGDHYELHGDLFGQMDALSRKARLIPHLEDGETRGFKLLAIRQGSPFYSCGLRNGDTIREINGMRLDGPERALEAYGVVQESGELTLTLTRRGDDQTIRIVLVED